MSPRSGEFLEQARDRALAAAELLDAGHLFRATYVVTDAFDAALFTLARHAQAAREGGDYEAVKPSGEEAERYVAGAGDFIAAIQRMLAA